MSKQKAELRNWTVVEDHLIGEVYGHPNFTDGTEVRTTRLVNWDPENKSATAETKNTIYTLGEGKK